MGYARDKLRVGVGRQLIGIEGKFFKEELGKISGEEKRRTILWECWPGEFGKKRSSRWKVGA